MVRGCLSLWICRIPRSNREGRENDRVCPGGLWGEGDRKIFVWGRRECPQDNSLRESTDLQYSEYKKETKQIEPVALSIIYAFAFTFPSSYPPYCPAPFLYFIQSVGLYIPQNLISKQSRLKFKILPHETVLS